MSRIRGIILAVFAVVVLGGGLNSVAYGITFFPPVTGFQDDNLDWALTAAGTPKSGELVVGDRLVGVLEFDQTHSILPAGQESPIAPEELTGVFDLTITSIIPLGGSVFTYTFTATPGSPYIDPAAPAGTAVSLYLDNTDHLNLVAVNCTSLDNCVDLANNGSLWMNVGFSGDADDEWRALSTGGNNTTDLAKAAATSPQGFYQYFLSILTNNTGVNFAPQDCTSSGCTALGDGFVDIIGGGQILGGQGLGNGAFARSDVDTQLAHAVPEPSTLLLLGAGLLGLSFISRRRNKESK